MPKTLRPKTNQQPYIYKLALTIDGEKKYYIDCNVEETARPNQMREGYTPSSEVIDNALSKGAIIIDRSVLHKFENSDQGREMAQEYLVDLKRFLKSDSAHYLS